MPKSPEAHDDNRIFCFTVLDREPDEILVELYKTPYTLVQENGV